MKCHNDIPINLNFYANSTYRRYIVPHWYVCHLQLLPLYIYVLWCWRHSELPPISLPPLMALRGNLSWLWGVSSPNLCKSQPNWVADKDNCLIQHQLNPSAASQLTSWLNFTPIQNHSVAPIMVTNATNHHQINLEKHSLLSICPFVFQIVYSKVNR